MPTRTSPYDVVEFVGDVIVFVRDVVFVTLPRKSGRDEPGVTSETLGL